MSDNAEIGRLGEDIAVQHLLDNGFEILERGWRSGHLEVDIIARKGNILHIVEVKCRRNNAQGCDEFAPEFAMNATKRSRLMVAIENYMRENDFDGEMSLDLFAVNLTTKGRNIRYYIGVHNA